MKFFVYLLVSFLIVLSGCSSKEVYTPKQVAGDWDKESSIEDNIVDRAYSAAKLDNNKVLSKEGVLPVKIAEEKRVLGVSDGWVMSVSIDGNLSMVSQQDPTHKKEFVLNNTVASAAVKDNTLAVLFANNEMALYDLQSKKLLFKEQGGDATTTDMRIEEPYFIDDLVIFPTLDGKIVVVNKEIKARLRSAIISTGENFNNVIYMSMIDNKIIVATRYKILSLSRQERRSKYDVRAMCDDGKTLFVATLGGRIISLTPDLQVIHKLKLPFAHILGMIADGKKLYLLEKEGYMIVVDKDTFDYKVYESDFSDDGFAFVGDKVFYVDDTKISIK